MSARVYYYPDRDGTLEVIDLLTGLSDLQPTRVWSQEASVAMGGAQTIITHGAWFRVEVRLDRFDDSDLAADLLSLGSTLARGGVVGVAESHAKAWAGYCRTRPQRGDLVVRTRGNQWHNQSASLAAGDYVVIESGAPDYRAEHCRVASVGGIGNSVITLAQPIRGSFVRLPVLVRHEGYWPAMVLPADARGAPIVTHDRRITWTLSLPLREDWGAVEAVGESTGAVQGTTQGGGLTVDAIVERSRALAAAV